ncbi:hypothetical protein GW17_00051359 [Ensete ventricosum]|nr:hypothetical protein GW17_00051359 [Ensete ventricosum]
MGSDTCDGYGGWDHVVEDAAVVIPNGEEEARATLMARLGAASPRFVDGPLVGEQRRWPFCSSGMGHGWATIFLAEGNGNDKGRVVVVRSMVTVDANSKEGRKQL